MSTNLKMRDPAHALRIAVKHKLHRDYLFGEVWNELFNKRHALVPDIMNSTKWQRLLRQVQTNLLRSPCRNRPLAVVLKHLRFAKQRFSSAADLVAKVVVMLLPIATLLAMSSADQRRTHEDRERAEVSLLCKLQSNFCLALWLSVDLGIVCDACLRLFDKKGHAITKNRL